MGTSCSKGKPQLDVRKNILPQGTGVPREAARTPVWEIFRLELNTALRNLISFGVSLDLSRKLD